MKIFCTDGTTVECEAFRALDAGILVFEDEPGGEEPHEEATGFVPLTQVKYVLPEGVQPGPGGQPAEQRPETRPAAPGIGGGFAPGVGGQTGSTGLERSPGSAPAGGRGGSTSGPGGSTPGGTTDDRRRR